jgi:hybrid polyketide synthase/nonribosomal peptide synthetase ACE1
MAVYQEPTADWICSMLAIVRVGAIYVPLERRNGLPRLATIVKTCWPTALLVDSTTLEDAKYLDVEDTELINLSLLDITQLPQVPISTKSYAAGIVLFTSETTGVPKDIMLKNGSLKNSIKALTNVYDIREEVVLQQTASALTCLSMRYL